MALVGGLYGGGAFATYTGGELRRPAWTFRLSTLSALAVMLVLTLGAWLVFRHTVGLDFAQSAAYLDQRPHRLRQDRRQPPPTSPPTRSSSAPTR